MARLKRSGESGALDTASSIGQFKEQIAALNDLMRQIAGNAAVSSGSAAGVDPLSAPFTLYVNPYTGSDAFVGGSYNTYEDTSNDTNRIASKLKRLELQRLECGYTPQRPFKTINRAVIEAAIITSKEWYTYTDSRAHVDCVSIVLSSGVHTLYNDPGESNTALTSWGTSKDPTATDLIKFNPSTGGVILPRGCSLCGPDLRKCTIRPNWIPSVADESSDYSNRRGMLKITGTGYFFGFTFMDKVGATTSHHLLDCFHFTSKAELDDFYAKAFAAVGDGADLSSTLTVTRGTEYKLVGPIDQSQAPSSAWDTTASASPYVFNCSVRSDYGLSGIFADGSKVEGLRSLVCANFTGVSLQKDMSCWQKYSSGSWVTPTYQEYIDTDPDSIRMNPARRSRHISAINNAFIQEVSVFAIGHGIHHFTDKGGEITITNSNSSFGACAALSKGYKTFSFPQDQNWSVAKIRVPLNLSEKTGNVRRIFLGVIASISSNAITLEDPLAIDATSSSIPAILLADGYSLRSGTKIWIENPTGEHWRTDLAASAWASSNPSTINISSSFTEAGTDTPIGTNPDTETSFAIGKRVYIRRLVDTRTPAERRVSIVINNTASSRIPERNYVLQTDPERTGGAVSRELTAGGSEVLIVSSAGSYPITSAGVVKSAELTIRRGAATNIYANNTYYKAGTVVRYNNKHYQALVDMDTESASPQPALWGETYVHTASDFNPEDSLSNETPFITIDTDTDAESNTQTCGIDFSTAFSSAGVIRNQYRSGVDYLGAHAFLVAMGLTSDAAHTALLPAAETSRERNPASSEHFPTAPINGAATGRGNWAVEFRRPSTLRLYGHAWEWAGYLNYSKSVPAAQKELSPQNKFTYYFTNEAGGRVVPQGSNEDGFNVTPRGLEDIETGATQSVENIGSSTLDQFQLTDFPNGLTASDITVDSLTINTAVAFPEVAAAKTNLLGPVTLADAAALRSSSAVIGSSDSARDADINSNPEVVTLKGLNYWKNENRLVTARTGTQVIYVDPVNGRNITDINTLLASPPVITDGNDSIANRQAVAVKTLRAAADYANQAYGPTTMVEYRLGPGVYLERDGIVFNTKARLIAYNFTTGQYQCNEYGDGQVPFMGGENETYSNYLDPTKQPIFLSYIYHYLMVDFISVGQGSLLPETVPLRLDFNYDASVVGIAWWGPTETMTAGYRTAVEGRTIIPDSFFPTFGGASTATWRDSAFADPDNALNYNIREHALKVQTTTGLYAFYGIRLAAALNFRSTGTVYNCAFGAMTPADAALTGGERVFETLIECSSNALSMSGIRLIGNIKLSSEVNTGSYAGIRYRDSGYTCSAYRFTGFAFSVFGPLTNDQRKPLALSLGTLVGRYVSGVFTYNLPWVNWTLLYLNYDNNTKTVTIGEATSTTDPTGDGWKSIGPAIGAFVNTCYGFTSTTYRNWVRYRHADFGQTSTNTCGFAGKFGDYGSSVTSGTTTTATKTYGALVENGMKMEPHSIFYGDVPSSLFSVAGGDSAVANGAIPDTGTFTSGLTAGSVGAWTTFTPLNIKLRGYKVGIDTTNANTITFGMVN